MDGSTGRIVVGVDGSTGGRAALRHALGEAARRRVAVEVITAYSDPDRQVGVLGCMPLGASGVLSQVLRELVRARTAAAVDEALSELRGARPPVTVHVAEGDPADVLLAAAAGSDLLVVGAHRHGRPPGVLSGSVGRRCVLHATCPVTVVPASEQRSAPCRVRPRADGGAVG